MSHFVIRTRNEFYDGWVAHLLQQPLDDARSDVWKDGWRTGAETIGGGPTALADLNRGRLWAAFDEDVRLGGNIEVAYVSTTECLRCGDGGRVVETRATGGLVSKPCECPAGRALERRAPLPEGTH